MTRSACVLAVVYLTGCAVAVEEDGFTGSSAGSTATGPGASSTTAASDGESSSGSGDEEGGATSTTTGDPPDGTSSGAQEESSGSAGSEGGGGSCGDAVKDRSEACDGSDFGADDCSTYGFDDGELTCTPQCTVDTSTCVGCGDGTKNGSEACDGADLGGDTCESLGFGPGSITCADDCSSIDTSQCAAAPECGDGSVNGTEECDGAQLGGETCVSLGYDGGALACSGACAFDTSSCTAACGGFGTPCGQPGGCCGGGCGMGGMCTINGQQVCCG
jgi:hypothetical protein